VSQWCQTLSAPVCLY